LTDTEQTEWWRTNDRRQRAIRPSWG